MSYILSGTKICLKWTEPDEAKLGVVAHAPKELSMIFSVQSYFLLQNTVMKLNWKFRVETIKERKTIWLQVILAAGSLFKKGTKSLNKTKSNRWYRTSGYHNQVEDPGWKSWLMPSTPFEESPWALSRGVSVIWTIRRLELLTASATKIGSAKRRRLRRFIASPDMKQTHHVECTTG